MRPTYIVESPTPLNDGHEDRKRTSHGRACLTSSGLASQPCSGTGQGWASMADSYMTESEFSMADSDSSMAGQARAWSRAGP